MEKKVTISDVDCETPEFHKALLQAFPKLHSGGGFEMLKYTSSVRKPEVIPFRFCSSAWILRAWIETARIYIRPIQADLDLTPTEEIRDPMVKMM